MVRVTFLIEFGAACPAFDAGILIVPYSLVCKRKTKVRGLLKGQWFEHGYNFPGIGFPLSIIIVASVFFT